MPERNPFEETRQAAQDWSPREQYISRSNLPPYRATPSDNVPDYFKGPYKPDLTREPSKAWELMGSKSDQPNRSGIMAFNDPDLNQMKNDYFGHRLFNTGWGQGLLNRWANKFGDEYTLNALEGLPDLEDKRGWLGADWDWDIGRNNIGLTGSWSW